MKRDIMYKSDKRREPYLWGKALFFFGLLETADDTQRRAQCSKGSDDNLDDELDDILLSHKANYEVGIWSYELRSSTFYFQLAEGDIS